MTAAEKKPVLATGQPHSMSCGRCAARTLNIQTGCVSPCTALVDTHKNVTPTLVEAEMQLGPLSILAHVSAKLAGSYSGCLPRPSLLLNAFNASCEDARLHFVNPSCSFLSSVFEV